MNRRLPSLVALALTSCAATQQASTLDTHVARAPSGNYVGVKTGPLVISRDVDYGNGVSIGGLFGHHIPDTDMALEVEMTGTVSSPSGDRQAFGDLDVYTLGAYGVYRTPGDLYFKAKGGLVYENLNVDVYSVPVEGAAINLSLGLGGGYRINDHISAELEWTVIDPDISFASLGLNLAL